MYNYFLNYFLFDRQTLIINLVVENIENIVKKAYYDAQFVFLKFFSPKYGCRTRAV